MKSKKKIQDVCAILLTSPSPNIRAAAKEHNVSYHTLRWRYLGLTQPCYKAHVQGLHQNLSLSTGSSTLAPWGIPCVYCLPGRDSDLQNRRCDSVTPAPTRSWEILQLSTVSNILRRHPSGSTI